MADTSRTDGCGRIADGTPRQAGIRWPEGVEELLVALVERANSAGANTTRKEVVAALLVQAGGTSAEHLRDSVLTYRQAKTRDVLGAGAARRGGRAARGEGNA